MTKFVRNPKKSISKAEQDFRDAPIKESLHNQDIQQKKDNKNNDIHIDIHSNIHPTLSNNLPWVAFNKKAIKPKKQFILKLNEYYHSALCYFSDPETGVSMQKIVSEIVQKGLDNLISESEKNKKD